MHGKAWSVVDRHLCKAWVGSSPPPHMKAKVLQMWFLLFFAILPLIEIALFIVVGGWLSLWPTLGLVILSSIAGVAVMRSSGTRAVAGINRAMSEMRDPAGPVADGAMRMAAGILLIVPGFLTDAIGLLLLLPPVRSVIRRRIAAKMPPPPPQSTRWPGEHGETVDADYHVIEPEKPRVPSGWTKH